MIEKAFAKLFGSYHAIESGIEKDALRDLTGAPSFSHDIRKLDKEKIWEIIDEGDQKGYIMSTSSS